MKDYTFKLTSRGLIIEARTFNIFWGSEMSQKYDAVRDLFVICAFDQGRNDSCLPNADHKSDPCYASLRSRPKKERARKRETHEERGRACPEGPRKSFQLAFCERGYFQLIERLPREKISALGEKTVNQ